MILYHETTTMKWSWPVITGISCHNEHFNQPLSWYCCKWSTSLVKYISKRITVLQHCFNTLLEQSLTVLLKYFEYHDIPGAVSYRDTNLQYQYQYVLQITLSSTQNSSCLGQFFVREIILHMVVIRLVGEGWRVGLI